MSFTSVRNQYMTPEYEGDLTHKVPRVTSLYYHVPFCKARCFYCDFRTDAIKNNDPEMQWYVDGLTILTKRLSRAELLGHLDTLYIGGGTPTHMGRSLVSLAYAITLLVNVDRVKEFTVECNPESVDFELYKDLWALGVNRFSVGVQSFVDEELKTIGRIHTAARAREAVELLLSRDARVSLDLMCGLPGQTLDSFEYSLREAVKLGVSHISVYPLTVEDGTPLASQIEAGILDGPDDDFEAQAMELASRILGEAGFYRYEVASYCKPGHESLHNQAYWTGENYLGLGTGAASMLERSLFEKVAACAPLELAPIEDLADQSVQRVLSSDPRASRMRFEMVQDAHDFADVFLARPQDESGKTPCVEIALETLDAREAAAEDLMLAMRRSAGISLERLHALCGPIAGLEPQARAVLDECAELGLVTRDEAGGYAPSDKGWLLGNELFGRLWGLATNEDEYR